MEFYDGAELKLFVDGVQPECLTGVTLSESMSLEVDNRAPLGWESFRPNLQEYTISCDGFDEGGYLYLLALKRQFTLVDWEINTPDLNIDITGQVYVTEVSRTSPFDNDNTFNATLKGFGRINLAVVGDSFRLLEDGDFRLLEDGDRRLLENA